MSEEYTKTERSRIRRIPKRGKYDRASVHQILDEGFLCHVGFAVEAQPFVIPTLYGRIGDAVFIHGSHISRLLKNLETGVKACVTVTLVDGLVLARSAFHHSMNYRSVVIFGTGRLVQEESEKLAALKAISDQILPHRWENARSPNEKELNVTSVIKIEIEEASAKIRAGGPVDDRPDYDLPIWAGVIPFEILHGTPVPDTELDENIKLPDYLKR